LAIIIDKRMLIQIYTSPTEFICIVIKEMAMLPSDGSFWDRFPLMNLRAPKKQDMKDVYEVTISYRYRE
jgi:hypothetical protein